MKRKIITTADGSKTIRIEAWNEQYHSIHGAINEANHVFIKNGLHFFCHSERGHLERPPADRAGSREVVSESPNPIAILEIGFGTGLNAFITLLEAQKLDVHVNYVGIEAYPVSADEISELNYPELISKEHEADFNRIHQVPWEDPIELNPHFAITKRQQLFEEIEIENAFDLIYFDAFGPRVQPQLWTETIFKSMFNALKPGGILVTYSAKGSVRRAMQSVGFTVERLEGPPGKRQMLRALK